MQCVFPVRGALLVEARLGPPTTPGRQIEVTKEYHAKLIDQTFARMRF